MASSGRPPPSTPPSPIKEGKDLWHITRKLEGRGSEGKEALDSLHDNALVYMRSCFNTAKRRYVSIWIGCGGSSLESEKTGTRKPSMSVSGVVPTRTSPCR